jgi:hypothetical protein
MDTSNTIAGEASPETPSSMPGNPAPAASGAAEKPDTMGFELALQLQDLQSTGFEAAVTAAIDSVGGELLFDMPMPAETDCKHLAAVSVGSGEERALMLVMLPKEGETLHVETVEESSHPVARIVAAYAGLKNHLAIAA